MQIQFQSTLPREERHHKQIEREEMQYFNPRSHERSDQIRHRQHSWIGISIHAPTRGATISNGLCDGFYAIFQSTLPREERLVAKDFTEGMVVFQSTLPREERRWTFSRVSSSINFNPRSHERSDALPPNKNRLTHVYFNPRSHERSDKVRYSVFIGPSVISIHAPTRGAT